MIGMSISLYLMGCEGETKSNPGNKDSKVIETKELLESPKEGFLAPSFPSQT